MDAPRCRRRSWRPPTRCARHSQSNVLHQQALFAALLGERRHRGGVFPLQAAIQLAAEVHQLLVASCQVGDRLQVAVALVAHRAGQLVEVLRIVPPLLAKLAQQAPGFAAVHAVESLQAGFRRLRRAFDQAGVALIAFLADVHEEGVQGFLRGEPHLVQGEQVIGGPRREDGRLSRPSRARQRVNGRQIMGSISMWPWRPSCCSFVTARGRSCMAICGDSSLPFRTGTSAHGADHRTSEWSDRGWLNGPAQRAWRRAGVFRMAD